LTRFEELIWQGKQGPGELPHVEKLLKAMVGAEVTFKWVQEVVRMRATAGGEENKDKAQLVWEIVEIYAPLDKEGVIQRLGNELLSKWAALAKN